MTASRRFRGGASVTLGLAIGFASVAGCAGLGAGGANGGAASADVVERLLLPTADSGLQVHQWWVRDDPDRIIAALMKHAAPAAPGESGPDQDRLRQNGFRLVRVNPDDLPALRADLGGTTRDLEGWYGQAYEWRTVAEVPITRSQAVAVDGRVRSMRGGRLRLVVRGWTTPMEDGPYLCVEAVPEHDRTRSTRLAQALGRRAFVGDRFSSAGLELMMGADSAWVLTTASPGEPVIAPADLTTAAGVIPEEDTRPAGPGVEAPPTVGALLLRREERSAPQRELLVFVPLIPASLAPAPLAFGRPRTIGGDPGATRP